MSTALLLLLYAAVLATVGARLLRRARWVQRAPRLGILTWQALTVSIVTSVLLAGLTLTVPTMPVASSLADFVHACVALIQAQYATPAGAATSGAGLLIVATVTGRLLFGLYRTTSVLIAERRRHRHALTLVGRPDRHRGVTVVAHDAPAAYCLPGRHQRIVLTTAALDTLDEDQIAAVLAHERAHLRARHDLVIAGAMALSEAFPRIRPFALANEQVHRLVELAADDSATSRCGRLALAEGILNVAGGPSPAATLGAGSAGGVRVQRLLTPQRRLGALRSTGVLVAVAALLVIPGWLAVAPAFAAADATACPLPPLSTSITPAS